MSLGVVFAAIGQHFVEEAIVSAASIKERNARELAVTLFTDQTVNSPYFDQIVRVEKGFDNPSLERVRLLGMSPYGMTLSLDTDTYIVDPIDEIFELGHHFDFTAAHAPGRITGTAPGISSAFPEFNGGVLLFGSSLPIAKFCSHWIRLYKLYGFNWGNQPSLRILTYRSRLRLATLPPEYNCRFLFTGYLRDRVKILHGHYRAEDYPKAAAALNSQITWRTHSQCKVYTHGSMDTDELVPIGQYPFRNPFEGVVND